MNTANFCTMGYFETFWVHFGTFWGVPSLIFTWRICLRNPCVIFWRNALFWNRRKIESAIPFRRKSAINSKGAFCNIFGSHTPLRPSLFQWSNIRCMCQEKTVVRRPCGTLLFIVFSKRWIYFVFYFEQSQSSPWEQPVKSVYWEGDSDRPGLKRWITLMGTKVFTYTWTPL